MKVPETCPLCGAKYIGGHALPGQDMKEGMRVFYACGASHSFKYMKSGRISTLTKNCGANDPNNDDVADQVTTGIKDNDGGGSNV